MQVDSSAPRIGCAGVQRTIETWFRPVAGTSNNGILLGLGPAEGSGTSAGFDDLLTLNTSGEVVWGTGASSDSCACIVDGSVHFGSWNHIAVQSDNRIDNSTGEKQLFLNARLLRGCTEGIKFPAQTNELTIGGHGYGTTGNTTQLRFVGYIDEVRIYEGLQYSTDFTPVTRHAHDAQTVLLLNIDEGGWLAGPENLEGPLVRTPPPTTSQSVCDVLP